MKSYEEFKEGVIVEGVDAKDADVWKKFIRAAEELENLLRRPNTLHALILNDIDHRMQDVREQLNRLDAVYKWKDEIRNRGGQLTQG